ncbi:MAG: CocE/NonD family hydrolase [Candidatus Lambdaproteobacteria bacterium]|nr:CocE/NonD family hydrolase [Candidatus Lambdaproteobacteria bacterium]
MAATSELVLEGGTVLLRRNVMVPMRDGVRLATDLYLPARGGGPAEGRFPLVLERTPYGKGLPSRSEIRAGEQVPLDRAAMAARFVGEGYAVAFQDCRGRYDSEGGFVKYLADGPDGYDTVEWLAAQPWCDGKIGTFGLSYAAHTQAALAALAPPHLACMFLDCGGFSDAYQSGIRQGGAFELKQATWAFRNALVSPLAERRPEIKAALEAEDIGAWFERMPWRPGHSPLQWVPEYEAYLLEQWTHGEFGDYWRQLGIHGEGYYGRYADVPMVHMSSWYDPYTRTATENYLGLSALKQGPVRLILGPWTHGDRSLSHVGDVEFGPAALLDGNLAPDYLALRLRWFDRWLRGIANGAERDPAVRVFVMGGGSGGRNGAGRLEHGGRWREAARWPLPGTRFTPYYLHGAGLLSPEQPPVGVAPLAYDFDPRRPVPTIGGSISSGAPVMEGGAFDQREGPRFHGCRPPYLPLSSRPDVLVFETPPLERDLEVVGPIEVHLWVCSNAPDTDFTAKLIDVYPPSEAWPQGFALNLTDGIIRCRYRNSWERPELLAPGEIVQVRIEPFPTGNRFAAGHRLRLDISSSNFPRFDVNPNTGEAEGCSRRTQVATNRVFCDRARPSHIVLPVLAE